MDEKVRSLTRALKGLDSDLFAMRSHTGTIHVMRNMNGQKHLFSLTHNWASSGVPIDLGIQPVLDHYREGDPETQGLTIARMQKKRERKQEDDERARRNEFRAIAHDLRRDFAKATSDINTSTMEKVYNRRKQDGYCK